MKFIRLQILNLILLFSLIVYIHSGTAKFIDVNNMNVYLNLNYLRLFSVPTSYISEYSDGGHGNNNLLENVFSYKYTGNWFTKIDTSNINITVTFKKNLFIKEMIYYQKYDKSADSNGELFPKEIKIYYSNEISKNAKFILAETIKMTPTNHKTLIIFSKIINCRQLRIEWEKKYLSITVMQDLVLLFPPTNYINYQNSHSVFNSSDYKQLTLLKTFNSTVISNMKKDLSSYGYNEDTKEYFGRIIGIAEGTVKYDIRREFSTQPKSSVNNIYQRGDIEKYGEEILKRYFKGTNRQGLGIYVRANENITIYVKRGKNTDPLPKLQFTQYLGRTNNWLGSINQLKEGKQVLKCDDFKLESDYDKPTFPGGPLYLINPYTWEEQGNISVYIEGGEVFPTFKLGDNEETYKKKLLENINLNKKNNKTYFDITELYGIRTMITVKASSAYNIYSNKTVKISPQTKLTSWDNFIKKLLIFDGVQFLNNEPYYDIRNDYINVHFRYSQQKGKAYAFAYHQYIGLCKEDSINLLLNFDIKTVGWAFPHEIGHTLDIPERTVMEISNNMISEYYNTVLRGDDTWSLKEHLPNKIKYLTDDTTSNNLRGCKDSNTANCKGFFNNIDYNYLIWWDLESINHGYWGKIDNMYRYDKTLYTGLSKEEKFVYFSSLLFKMDLGYYFTRWGLSFRDKNINIFNENKVSSKYKELMNSAKAKGLIDKNAVKKKFWYLDNKEYMFISNINTGCYKDKSEYNVQITSVVKSGNYYKINLPNIKCPGHLGFEIYESNKLIAFTYGTSYTDNTSYTNGYVPKYKIIAYDRLLEVSNPSSYKSSTTSVSLKLMNLLSILNE